MKRKNKQGKAVEQRDKGPDFSLGDSSQKTDATMKDPLHESPDLPDLSSSQTVVKCNSTNKKYQRKRLKTQHNAVKRNFNGCGSLEDTLSLKTSAAAFDMPSEQPIQYVSSDSVTRQSCVKADISLGQNEEKEQNMLQKAAENSNGECDVQEVSCSCNSVLADAVSSAKESVFEFGEKNIDRNINDSSPNPEEKSSSVKNGCVKAENEEKEQNMLQKACDVQEVSCNCNSVVADVSSAKESVFEFGEKNIDRNINDNSPNPEEEKSSSVKNASLVKKHYDDNPGVCDLSDRIQYVYRKRKISNFKHRGNCGYASPVNCNKEPAMQDRQEDDDPHKFPDGPLAVDLVEGETKFSNDQVNSYSGAAAEGMELVTGSTSEQRFITKSSVVDVPVTQPEETKARQLDHAEITRNDLCCPGDVSDLSSVTINDGNSKISQFSLDRTIISYPKKKLLILDVNGLLADLVSDDSKENNLEPEPDFWLKRRKVYKRPFCEDFLQFCFDRFHVGVWSSRKKSNVDEVIKFLMGKSASKLLFCWNQYHCTWTKFTTVEDIHKPLVLKELRKLWEKRDSSLPWEKGEFNESNTLLLDDSPYKALVNPKHTAVFPYTYRYQDTTDSSLGPGGDLRVYLEGLVMAENVQEYVSSNPFGQRPIRETNPSWGYYRKVLESVKRRYQNRNLITG
ncbi:uncharacterized protein LOC130734676 isoform X2 [Lotus japonicus]|nr:uncharacterized protein LOC130734676 isoform X2 [Lotus japonicus]XP_057443176.1 uncharacterized protein LOC130734676 isoform X2 [Lotus japonicus]